MASEWDQYKFEATITEILADVQPKPPEHHFGRPYLSAYQLAIEFAHRRPEVVEALKYEVGGAGTGAKRSLAKYFASELSGRIKYKRITHIEGAFLSNTYLNGVAFNNIINGTTIHESTTEAGFDLSMFRLRGDA